jgi:hypothetical protein
VAALLELLSDKSSGKTIEKLQLSLHSWSHFHITARANHRNVRLARFNSPACTGATAPTSCGLICYLLPHPTMSIMDALYSPGAGHEFCVLGP